jgi:hypothetical protein
LSRASGFFISGNGHILTNKHVVRKDLDSLEAAETQLDEKKKQIARMDRQLRNWRKKRDADEQWLARTKQELAALKTKRVFPSKRLARKHIEKMTALTDTYNARLDSYMARSDQYGAMQQAVNGQKDELDKAIKVYDEMMSKASGRNRPHILLADGTELDVEILIESPRYDAALLKLDGYRTPFLVPEDPDSIAVSDPVYAIGNPTGAATNTVAAGNLINIISDGVLSGQNGVFLQTDAKIYPGNSGGPLVDGKGRVLGINTMKEVTRKFEGLGYALSIRIALDEFKDILGDGPG